MAKKDTFRRRWAIFAAVLSALAVGFELVTQICTLVFDPLPDIWCGAAYVFLIVMLLFNEYVLYRAGEFPLSEEYERKLNLAGLGTYAAIGIAAVYTVLFVPVLPLTPFAMFYYWCGLGAWSPLVNLIVLSCQMKALIERRRLHHLGPIAERQSFIVGAYVLLCACVLLAVMPPERRSVVLQCAPGYRMFSSWWEYISHYPPGMPWDGDA